MIISKENENKIRYPELSVNPNPLCIVFHRSPKWSATLTSTSSTPITSYTLANHFILDNLTKSDYRNEPIHFKKGGI